MVERFPIGSIKDSHASPHPTQLGELSTSTGSLASSVASSPATRYVTRAVRGGSCQSSPFQECFRRDRG